VDAVAAERVQWLREEEVAPSRPEEGRHLLCSLREEEGRWLRSGEKRGGGTEEKRGSGSSEARAASGGEARAAQS
jgi:hypothetical protein